MKTSPPALSPFVRSDAQGELLAELFLHPDHEHSLAELGRRTGLAPSVVHKEVERLVSSEVLVDRREGRSRLVRANVDHPLYTPMRQIILATYGPVPVIREELQGLEGVQRAFIYGSWAERREGNAGLPPGDIDLLVVGRPARRALAAAASRAADRLGLEVNATRVAAAEWEAEVPSPFVQTVRQRPLVELT